MGYVYRLSWAALFVVVLVTPTRSFAHCDSVAGPVAKDVKLALDSGQLSPVLKWIRATDESELRAVFDRAVSVRKSGGEAATLADQFFLETAVRLHRASEGEPYTGLKPASAADEPAPAMVDAALKTNSFEAITDSVISDIRAELKRRIEALKLTRAQVNVDPVLGREYVRTYVELVHYVERLQSSAVEHKSAEGPLHGEE